MPAEGIATGRLAVGSGRMFSKSQLEAVPANGCNGLFSSRLKRWSQLSRTSDGSRPHAGSLGQGVLGLREFSQSARTCWPKKTPDPVARITCYSTRIWAFSVVFALALQRDARLSADDDRSCRAAIVWHIEKQPKSLLQLACHCGSSRATKEP